MKIKIIPDLSDILEILENKDPILKIVFKSIGYLPLFSNDISAYNKSVYVSLIGAIIGQLISFKQARKIRSNLYSLSGDNFDLKSIDDLSGNKLESLGISKDKIRIIRDVNKYLSKILILRKKDHGYAWEGKDITVKILKQLKANVLGIGEWTTETVYLTSFLTSKGLDIFPMKDVFIKKRIKELYGITKKKDIEALTQKWKPYRGIVTWYLWRYNI
jgi:DNA-3-methyladenine glycosylase II